MIVMEFVARGSLLDLLIGRRYFDHHNPNEMNTRLEYHQMIKFLYDIASGMEFLAAKEVFTKFLF